MLPGLRPECFGCPRNSAVRMQRCIGVRWQSFASVCGARSVGPGCVAAQVDADTLEMLRTINAGSLPGVKEVAVRGAGAPGHAAGVR